MRYIEQSVRKNVKTTCAINENIYHNEATLLVIVQSVVLLEILKTQLLGF